MAESTRPSPDIVKTPESKEVLSYRTDKVVGQRVLLEVSKKVSGSTTEFVDPNTGVTPTDVSSEKSFGIVSRDNIFDNLAQSDNTVVDQASNRQRMKEAKVERSRLEQEFQLRAKEFHHVLTGRYEGNDGQQPLKYSQDWNEFFSNYLKVATGKTQQEVKSEHLYDLLRHQYFTGDDAESQTKAFEEHILRMYTTTQRVEDAKSSKTQMTKTVVDRERLTKDLDKIQHIATLFGTDGINEIIAHLLDERTEAFTNTDAYIETASKEQPLDKGEMKLIANDIRDIRGVKDEKGRPRLSDAQKLTKLSGKEYTPQAKQTQQQEPKTEPQQPKPDTPPVNTKQNEEPKSVSDKLKDLQARIEKRRKEMTDKEIAELDRTILNISKYLERFDKLAESVTVDENTGKIEYTQPQLDGVDPTLKEYDELYQSLLAKYEERNNAFEQKLKTTNGVLDVKNVNGALVATYDSSKGVPLLAEASVHSEDDLGRGVMHVPTEHYLGCVFVDINKAKRTVDNVKPTTTAVHELQHFGVAMTDYMLYKDKDNPFASAYRSGRERATELFSADDNRIQTNELFNRDRDKYALLLGRDSSQIVINDLREQLAYLDELHSSFLQRKLDWFSANHDIYNGYSTGKHWELVGNNPQDIETAKKMVAYLQGFYSLDLMRKGLETKLQTEPQSLNEDQKAAIRNLDQIYRKAGGIIGASRTVQQSERLLEELWNTFGEVYPNVLTSPSFDMILNHWESKGAGVDNLRTILLSSVKQTS